MQRFILCDGHACRERDIPLLNLEQSTDHHSMQPTMDIMQLTNLIAPYLDEGDQLNLAIVYPWIFSRIRSFTFDLSEMPFTTNDLHFAQRLELLKRCLNVTTLILVTNPRIEDDKSYNLVLEVSVFNPYLQSILTTTKSTKGISGVPIFHYCRRLEETRLTYLQGVMIHHPDHDISSFKDPFRYYPNVLEQVNLNVSCIYHEYFELQDLSRVTEVTVWHHLLPVISFKINGMINLETVIVNPGNLYPSQSLHFWTAVPFLLYIPSVRKVIFLGHWPEQKITLLPSSHIPNLKEFSTTIRTKTMIRWPSISRTIC